MHIRYIPSPRDGAAISQRTRFRKIAPLTAIALAALLAACEGDVIAEGPAQAGSGLVDDKGKVDDGGNKDATNLLFDVKGNASGPRVELQPTKTGADTFELRLVLRDFSDLFGVAGHLRYDPKNLSLQSIEKHKVLDDGAFDSKTVAADSPKGRVLLGATRFRTTGSPFSPLLGAKVGKQVWVTMKFKVLQSGEHTIAWDDSASMVKTSKYEDVETDFATVTVQRKEATR